MKTNKQLINEIFDNTGVALNEHKLNIIKQILLDEETNTCDICNNFFDCVKSFREELDLYSMSPSDRTAIACNDKLTIIDTFLKSKFKIVFKPDVFYK
jgi:hypothetical protein